MVAALAKASLGGRQGGLVPPLLFPLSVIQTYYTMTGWRFRRFRILRMFYQYRSAPLDTIALHVLPGFAISAHRSVSAYTSPREFPRVYYTMLHAMLCSNGCRREPSSSRRGMGSSRDNNNSSNNVQVWKTWICGLLQPGPLQRTNLRRCTT